MNIKQKKNFPCSSALRRQITVALVGLLFCLWVFLSGGKSLCLTDGCSLFQDFKIGGFSLWQGGILFFVLCLICTLFRLRKSALFLTASALCAEIILLFLMLLTAPCINCLVVGSIIAFTYFMHWRETVDSIKAKRIYLPLIPWLLLFCFNVGIALQSAYSPWPIIKKDNAMISIFFSPSCSACRELVQKAEKNNTINWFPVSESFRDNFVIRNMTEKINAGIPLLKALEEARKEIPPQKEFDTLSNYKLEALSPKMILLQLRLWRNQAVVFSSQSKQIPLVIIKGLPEFLSDKAPHNSTDKINNAAKDNSLPINLNVSKFCGGDKKEESCEESPQAEQKRENLEDLFKDSGLY